MTETPVPEADELIVGAQVNQGNETKRINAKALNDHPCDASEWHFVITQVSSPSLAPASIKVTWSNGSSQTVSLARVTGGTAHYYSFSNLDSAVTGATASIYEGWGGQFNLSHGPCVDPEPTPEPDPEFKLGVGSCLLESTGVFTISITNTGDAGIFRLRQEGGGNVIDLGSLAANGSTTATTSVEGNYNKEAQDGNAWVSAGGSHVLSVEDHRTNGLLCPEEPEPEPEPVRPILECVLETGDGGLTAFFGYLNENDEQISIPVGSGNRFTPEPQDQGQPTLFNPGRTAAYPNAAFSVPFSSDTTLVWTLDGRTSTAFSDSTRCPTEPTPPPDPDPVVPLQLEQCVLPNSDGSFTATFSYINENPFPVEIPVGPGNFFSPAPENRGQPTTFVPAQGTGAKTASIILADPAANQFQVVFSGGQLTWTLQGSSITADSGNLCRTPPNNPDPPDISLDPPDPQVDPEEPILIPVTGIDKLSSQSLPNLFVQSGFGVFGLGLVLQGVSLTQKNKVQ